jgi:FAD/FMN-containing dehydrogenase
MELLTPEDPGWDTARRINNERLWGRPALIARCASTDDVRDALALARARGLELSVRSGGHSVAGWSTNDGGLVVDLTPLRSIRLDPDTATAWVGGGTRAGDLVLRRHRSAWRRSPA